MSTNEKFKAIPAGACVLNVGEFELGSNGENAKSAPVRLVARSGKPIEHWFWGRVVHDLAGMHLHKSRIPIDYVHDPKEVIGFLNKFDKSSGDLVTSGALVPFGANDRATEIIHKSAEGVPYEASINFGGDGIKVEEIADGGTTTVNGLRFDGPGIVIREWPLRGVAICPYGADQNTESSVLADKNKVFSATVLTATPEAKAEGIAMSEKPVEAVAQAETPKAEEVKPETQQAAPVEVPVVEAEKAVEASPVEAAQPVKKEGAKQEADKQESVGREEFARIAKDFGNDIAAKVMCEGGDYIKAQSVFCDTLRAENAALKTELAEYRKQTAGTPVPVVAAIDPKKKKLFNTGK